MNILLLGGTRFVGRHIVEAALQHGHRVSTFTRGNNPLPGTESLVGDRKNGNLEALEGRTWDAVVDVNAYIPREVREATKVLKGRVGRYAFISTVSVYQESSEPRSEASPLLELSNPTVGSDRRDLRRPQGALRARGRAGLWRKRFYRTTPQTASPTGRAVLLVGRRFWCLANPSILCSLWTHGIWEPLWYMAWKQV